MKKIILSIFGIVLVLSLLAAAKLFIIGEPVDGNTVICDVTSNEHQINIHVTTPASAIAFLDEAQFRQEGTKLYITLRKVLVSDLNSSGEWCLYLEKMDLTEIYLGGKLIWSE